MKIVDEFKDFINKGNAMDLAVGVIIGGAFTAIVTSLTDDILNPLLKLICGDGSVAGLTIPIPGTDQCIDFSSFISAIINFLLIAIVVFLLVKGLKSLQEKGSKMRKKGEEEAEEAPAPVCPHCLEEVKEGATRCPHCTGEIK